MPKYDYLNVTHTVPLPTPSELLRDLPCKLTHQSFISQARHQICQILEGKDPRILLIVGPCSIHDPIAAKEYALKLRELSLEVSDSFYIVMRTYFEKPRTSRGWKGLLYDPDLNGSHDIENGLRLTRQLLLDLAEIEIPTAAEFLDPSSSYYFGDLISWGCIGARTASSQTHRQMASGLSMPVAFKNSTDGNIEIAINGILNAVSPHTFIGNNSQGQICSIQTSGNLYSHMVLRGGKGSPNYDTESISHAVTRLKHFNLLPHLLIDCSHDNSQRQHEQQSEVFQSVIRQVVEGNHSIRGLLLESHLFAGNQPLSNADQLKYAVSITDPCLDWQTTENLIRWGHAEMQNREAFSSVSHMARV